MSLTPGGMGEVYKARDSKLNRDVTLKVLPDSFANDPERLARFQREAQVLVETLGQSRFAADGDGSPAAVLTHTRVAVDPMWTLRRRNWSG